MNGDVCPEPPSSPALPELLLRPPALKKLKRLVNVAIEIINGLDLLLFRVREDVRFEVGGLGELFVASVERTDVGPITRMDPDVCPEVEVEREALSAALERALKGFLARVHELMTLQLGALDEGFTAFGAHVNPRAMRVQVFPHR